MESTSLPCPPFEGFEKRLDIEFEFSNDLNHADHRIPKFGLRSIPRNELDSILSAAECTIVSTIRNPFFDSYVLSESSLFVYPNRIVIKTCGTTKLLLSIPLVLDSALKIQMRPKRCRYTRGTFMFPESQPVLHRDFSSEAQYLDQYFGGLGNGGKAYVLGDALNFSNWHIYVADSASASAPIYTLEMCMTNLDRSKARQFFQSPGVTASSLTQASGIGSLLPNSQIDDFLFDPCGYSMNGIEGNAHSTIHITPEDDFSYASFETMGYSDSDVKISDLINKVLSVFNPSNFSIALHVNGFVQSRESWCSSLPGIPGYYCDGTSRQVLPLNSCIAFHTFKRVNSMQFSHVVEPLALIEDSFDVLKSTLKSTTPTVDPESILKPSPLILENLVGCNHRVVSLISEINPSVIGGSEEDVDDFIRKFIVSSKLEDPFYVMDISQVLHLWDTWTIAMPRVRPYYAVKCNPDPVLLSILCSLGAGFDVASQSEIDAALSIGASASDLIFANPCKLPSHMSQASKCDVTMTTFDSEVELVKFKKHYPNVQAVLRLRADDRGARCPLGVKYGAEYGDCEDLLMRAKELGITVVGIAFHVGSGASDPDSYADGIQSARSLFDTAVRLGMQPMKFLDIGGGFTSKGGNGMSFKLASSVINDSLDKCFPESMGVTVIGEPGRFFAEAPFTLAAHVFGSRFRSRHGHDAIKPEYWINDGLYGSMNCLLYDHAILSTRPLKTSNPDDQPNALYQSTVFGPTCDGLDTVLRDVWLPKLDCGDWLVFPRMGAYTQAAGTSFNGFDTKKIGTQYVFSVVSSPKVASILPEWSSDGYSSSDSGDERAFDSLTGDGRTNFAPKGSGMSSSDDDSF